VLIADEPTTALDGLLQARVLQTLRSVGFEKAGALELITHDLAVLASFADRIAIMYAGRVVEEAPTGELITRPLHPYTRTLLSAAPALERRAVRPLATAPATIRSAAGIGCSYAPRCACRTDRCVAEPDVVERAPGHRVACWRAGEEVA
jgi:peptide/nickel transport system ATP-binding protein